VMWRRFMAKIDPPGYPSPDSQRRVLGHLGAIWGPDVKPGGGVVSGMRSIIHAECMRECCSTGN
jgi:hypothetical protein